MSNKLWNRNFILLLGVTFCSGMTAQLISTAITPYMTYGLSFGTEITGVLSSIYTIVSCIGRLFAGNLVDRFGRKKFIFIGFCFFGVGCLLFGIVMTIELLIIFRVLQGIGFAVTSASSSAASADAIPPKRLGSGLGYISMVNALTQIIGPLVCTSLMISSYHTPFFFATAACLAACIIAIFTRDTFIPKRKAEKAEKAETAEEPSLQPEPAESAEPEKTYHGLAAIFEKQALIPALFQFFISLSFSVYMVWGYNLAETKGFGDIVYMGGIFTFVGMFFAFGAVGMILARLVMTRLADRIPEYLPCIPAALFGAASFLLVYLSPATVVYLLGAVLYGISLGIIQPALNTRSLRGIAPERRGAAIATFMLGFDGGIGIGATVWGFVIGRTSYDFMTIVAGAILVVVAVLFVVAWRVSAVKDRRAA